VAQVSPKMRTTHQFLDLHIMCILDLQTIFVNLVKV